MANEQHIFSGVTAPSSAPADYGHHYVDTAAKIVYLSVGTSSVNDWVAVNGSDNQLFVSGSKTTPNILSAATTIPSIDKTRHIYFLKSNGGAVSSTSIPQIQAGVRDGQQIVLCGTSSTDTFTIHDGDGVQLNGPSKSLKQNSKLTLMWDGALWSEESRNDI